MEESQKKGEEINKILLKNKEKEELKKKEYLRKHEELQKQKAAIELILQEEAKMKQQASQIKEKKIQQVLLVNEMQENFKKEHIKKKLEIKEITVTFY